MPMQKVPGGWEMSFKDKVSFSAGTVYALFFYIKFQYGVWDFIVLWAGNFMFLLSWYLIHKNLKEAKKDE